MVTPDDAATTVQLRMGAILAKLRAHVAKTHVVQTVRPMWYVYAGHNLMKTCGTREAAEAYMRSDGTRYVVLLLCQHAMGPP
jgi:hypothetical protein